MLIDGYAEALDFLAQYLEEHGGLGVAAQGASCRARRPCPQRAAKLIEEAFGCQVFDKYGSARVLAASPTSARRTTATTSSAEGYIVEVLRDGRPAAAGRDRRGGDHRPQQLLHAVHPLPHRRSRRGARPDEPCACGRGLPRIGDIEGRVQSIIQGTDGQLRAGHLLRALPQGVRPRDPAVPGRAGRARRDHFRVVKGARFSDDTLDEVMALIRQYLGETHAHRRRVRGQHRDGAHGQAAGDRVQARRSISSSAASSWPAAAAPDRREVRARPMSRCVVVTGSEGFVGRTCAARSRRAAATCSASTNPAPAPSSSRTWRTRASTRMRSRRVAVARRSAASSRWPRPSRAARAWTAQRVRTCAPSPRPRRPPSRRSGGADPETHFVYCSTYKTYGPHAGPIDPQRPPQRPDPHSYGCAKSLAERLLPSPPRAAGCAMRSCGRPASTGRASTRTTRSLCSSRRCGTVDAPTVFGSGRDVRDDVFAPDLAYCLAEACLRRRRARFTRPAIAHAPSPRSPRLCCDVIAKLGGPSGVPPRFDESRPPKWWLDQVSTSSARARCSTTTRRRSPRASPPRRAGCERARAPPHPSTTGRGRGSRWARGGSARVQAAPVAQTGRSMKVVVTGATGHLGTYTVAGLAALGHEVIAVSRSGALPALPFGASRTAAACVALALDLDTRRRRRRARGRTRHPTRCSCTSPRGIPQRPRRRPRATGARCSTSTCMARCARSKRRGARRAACSRWSTASTFEVYGEPESSAPSTSARASHRSPTTARPSSPAKITWSRSGTRKRTRVVALRLPAIYGPGEHTPRALPNFLRAVARARARPSSETAPTCATRSTSATRRMPRARGRGTAERHLQRSRRRAPLDRGARAHRAGSGGPRCAARAPATREAAPRLPHEHRARAHPARLRAQVALRGGMAEQLAWLRAGAP